MNENKYFYIIKLIHNYNINTKKSYIIGLYDEYKNAILKYQSLCINAYNIIQNKLSNGELKDDDFYVVIIYKLQINDNTFDIENLEESEKTYNVPCYMNIINKTWKLSYINKIPIRL